MGKFALRFVISAVALWITAAILDGIELSQDILNLVYVVFIFGLINALVRPIVTLLTCPFYIVTLGLFKFVVNAFMLLLADRLAGQYLQIDGFLTALLASIIISIISTALSMLLMDEVTSE